MPRNAEVYRAATDPLWMARKMGYDRITEDFHEPMMREMWARDLQRPLIRAAIEEQVEAHIFPTCFLELLKGHKYVKNEGECWARDHYKTTVFIVRCAKNILLWPEITIAHWHAVEKKAIEASQELGDHFQTNSDLRSMRPAIMPSKSDGRFNTASGFTVNRRRKIRGIYQKKERHPTFFPKGAGAEVTGGHAAMGWLDDIVGQTTIDDSGMPKIRNWMGNTVSHVIRTDGGWLYASYTPWDEDDVMTDWEKDKRLWDVRVRPCWKDEDRTEGALYPVEFIERKRRDPNCNFPYQMECDRVPHSERRWPGDWNGFCKRDWAMQGKGRIFVLSDPAPMGLSVRGDKDQERGDTGKDWWTLAVIRLRVRGEFLDNILLDVLASQSWSDARGYDEVCRLMIKWGTNIFLDEDYNNQLFQPFHAAARRAGISPYLERRKDGRGYQLPKYKESYIKNAKKVRFQKLCDLAETGGLWVSDSCPEEFWKGNGHSTGALTQASKWIPRKGGNSNLKWDDHFDVWARSTDSKLSEFAPKMHTKQVDSAVFGRDPYNRDRYKNQDQGYRPTLTRYI